MFFSLPWKTVRLAAQHLLVSMSICVLFPALALADVVVLANRTREAVPVRIVVSKRQRRVTIAPGQQTVVPVSGSCQLLYQVDGELVRYQLDANSVCFFTLDDKGWLDLRRVDLGEDQAKSESASTRTLTPANDKSVELPVKILVDNHDPTPRQVWEKRLRRRVDQASKILQQHCRVKLKIVAIDTWDSGNQAIEFDRMLNDFRRRVDPQPGRLAIGFTGRDQTGTGRVDLGATQGMLQSHILIREWAASMSEPERTEVLLHEIGHYLGAVHTPDSGSVMRPVLADNRAIANSFHIGFDPVNTLIINMVADEIRARQADSVTKLSPEARQRLAQTYRSLLKALPSDKSIRQYLSQLDMADGTPLTHATRLIVREVRRSAQTHHAVAKPVVEQMTTDELTELYLRRAATVAKKLPRDIASPAFILGLGIALDDSNTLLSNPITAGFCRKVETETERQARHRALGSPTLRGRRDLAQHFFLSAYLTAVVGGRAAESAGIAKELADSRSQSGFSYRDLAADVAGINFARRLLDGHLALSDVARGLTIVEVMPEVADLPDGVPWKEIDGQMRGQNNQTARHYRTVIHHRVHQLYGDVETVEPLTR